MIGRDGKPLSFRTKLFKFTTEMYMHEATKIELKNESNIRKIVDRIIALHPEFAISRQLYRLNREHSIRSKYICEIILHKQIGKIIPLETFAY